MKPEKAVFLEAELLLNTCSSIEVRTGRKKKIYIVYNKIKLTSRGKLYRHLIVTRRKHLVLTAGGKMWWVGSVSGARRRSVV
jgi:hypothetical protein